MSSFWFLEEHTTLDLTLVLILQRRSTMRPFIGLRLYRIQSIAAVKSPVWKLTWSSLETISSDVKFWLRKAPWQLANSSRHLRVSFKKFMARRQFRALSSQKLRSKKSKIPKRSKSILSHKQLSVMMTLCKMLLNWLSSFVMKTNQSLKNEFCRMIIFSKHFYLH